MDSNARRLRGITLLATLLAFWGLWRNAVPRPQVSDSREPRFQVDLNRSPAYELELLPGLGPKRIEEIEAYRQRGPFGRTEELDRIPGIGEARMEVLSGAITVESAGNVPFEAPPGSRVESDDNKEESP